MTVEEVIIIHAEIIAEGGPGNEPGILDVGSIETAIYRHKYGPFASDPPGISQRAAYLMRIAQDHPFFEANKRTAFEVTDFFLRHNGFEIGPIEVDAFHFLLRLAGIQFTDAQRDPTKADPVQLIEICDWLEKNLKKL